MDSPIVVSFFSYKGGAGRTTSTLNTTYYLVKEVLRPTRDNPLLIIDADTESAGISYLLTKNCDSIIASDRSVQGLCRDAKSNGGMFNPDDGAVMPDLFSAYSALRKKFIPVGEKFGVDEKSVLLLRSNVNASEFHMTPEDYVDPMEKLIKLANKTCKCPVIFDTPSGTQSLTTCSLRLSDVIVSHMRPTAQFQEGTRDYLQRYLQQDDVNFKDIILCPSVVPTEPVRIDNDQYPDTYRERLVDFVTEINQIAASCFEVNIIDLMTKPTPAQYYRPEFRDALKDYHEMKIVGIPEITRFKWSEGLLPIVPNLTTEEKLACERYFYLANIIAGKTR